MLPSILCCLSLSFRACRPEVTVTSLHPPRLCRIAVLLVKPIVSLSRVSLSNQHRLSRARGNCHVLSFNTNQRLTALSLSRARTVSSFTPLRPCSSRTPFHGIGYYGLVFRLLYLCLLASTILRARSSAPHLPSWNL